MFLLKLNKNENQKKIVQVWFFRDYESFKWQITEYSLTSKWVIIAPARIFRGIEDHQRRAYKSGRPVEVGSAKGNPEKVSKIFQKINIKITIVL